MNCLERAAKYIGRKKRNTSLLLLLFCIINVMVSGTLAIRASSLGLAEELRRNSESKVMLESLHPQDGFDGQDLKEIAALGNVNRINRISETECMSHQLLPVAGNDESGYLFDIHGYDEVEKDSPFEARVYRIVEGEFPGGPGEIVINQYLAGKNGIHIGDKVSFQSVERQNVEAVVTGFFLTGVEERQTENVATVNRIENQVYATVDFVSALSGADTFINAAVYVHDPELLEDTCDTLAAMYEGRAATGTMNHTFQQLNLTIEQTERMTSLILLLTIFAGYAAVGLLLAMWTRGRKKEIAVLVSLGVSKGNIFLQMLLEGIFLYGIAFVCAQIITSLFLPAVGNQMVYLQGEETALRLSSIGMGYVLCGGLAGVMVLTGFSAFPYMKKQVKEILSEMEG